MAERKAKRALCSACGGVVELPEKFRPGILECPHCHGNRYMEVSKTPIPESYIPNQIISEAPPRRKRPRSKSSVQVPSAWDKLLEDPMFFPKFLGLLFLGIVVLAVLMSPFVDHERLDRESRQRQIDRQREQLGRDQYDQMIKDIAGERAYEEGRKYPELFKEKYKVPAPGRGQVPPK